MNFLAQLIALTSTTQGVESTKNIIVVQWQFQCLVTKIEKFENKGDSITVDISHCPPTIIRGYTTIRKEKTVKTRLTLTPKDILCIKANRRSINRIARPLENSLYVVDLTNCGRPA
jgi:hypothetical protein